jgi:preprotein translocase subunit YajC
MLPTQSKTKRKQQKEIEEQVQEYLAKGRRINLIDGTGYQGKATKIKDFSINGKGSDGVKKQPTKPETVTH